MRKLINELAFGSNAIVSGTIALAVVCSIVLGCNCGKDFDLANLAKNASQANTTTDTEPTSERNTDSLPSESEVESIVKDTVAEFADAIESDDFSALYNNASSDFRSTYGLDEIRTAFKTYVDKKKVVLPVLKRVAASDAQFSPSPSMRTGKGLKILVAKGMFPTKPYTVHYDYEYVMRDGDWKLLKLVINIP